MFFKVLAAIVTADAFDRRMRAQQRRQWVAEDARQQTAASAPTVAWGSGHIPTGGTRWNLDTPERPMSSDV